MVFARWKGMGTMKYQITIDVQNLPEVDVATLSGVLSYILTNSVKQVPGVITSSIETIEVVVDAPVEETPTDPLPESPPVDEPPVEETPTDPLPESPPVDEPPVDSPSTE